MNNLLNFHAITAWAAFGNQDFRGLEEHGNAIYNYFVHNPEEILHLDSPLMFGKIFQVCLGFQEPDEDIQEVRAENAFLCFSQALDSTKVNVHDEACARLMMLLIQHQNHLAGKVEQACRNENASRYNVFDVLSGGMSSDMPSDMPIATNTKMLLASYYLYCNITDKENVYGEFVNMGERNSFRNVKEHILEACNQLGRSTSERKAELGQIVFEKICNRLHKDIELYSKHNQS